MSLPPITISLNPWYFCNFRCSFCYLTEQQLSDTTLLSLERLQKILTEVSEHYTIEHVDIYGGEVLLLPQEYRDGLLALLRDSGCTDINLNTNLSLVNDTALDPDITLSVSYDFEAREKSQKVLENMLTLPREYRVLTLVGRKFLDTVSVDECVWTFNLLGQMYGVEFKPYSTNQANQDAVSFTEFEDFVYAVMTHPDRSFEVENESLLNDVLGGTRNAFSDDHLYVTPKGELAVLEFDDQDREFFLPVEGVAGYRKWCQKERQRVSHNPVCGSCKFFGGCLSEHLRPVVDLNESCNGFHNLIVKWAES